MKMNQKPITKQKKKRGVKPQYKGAFIGLIILFLSLFIIVLVAQQRQSTRSVAAPSADLLVDKPNQSFTSGQYTAPYHLYAAGLDYSKPVGMLLFADGSGESGFSKPDSSYQMGGSTGLIAVAKKHNMILLYPASPNRTCKCWDEGDRSGYATWAEALVTQVESQYQIDKKRVAVGGYSSGGTLESLSWLPSGAAQRTMDAGVIVFIAAGASGGDGGTYTPAFKANVHMYWSVGDQDEFFQDNVDGQKAFAAQGFQTAIDILPGKDHSRSGEFGPIMDAQISKFIPDSAGSTIGVPSPVCAGSSLCVPSTSPTPLVTTNPSPTSNISIAPSVTQTPPSASPSNSEIQLPTINPPGDGDGNNPGNKNGIIGFFLLLIQLLLEFFRSLFK